MNLVLTFSILTMTMQAVKLKAHTTTPEYLLMQHLLKINGYLAVNYAPIFPSVSISK